MNSQAAYQTSDAYGVVKYLIQTRYFNPPPQHHRFRYYFLNHRPPLNTVNSHLSDDSSIDLRLRRSLSFFTAPVRERHLDQHALTRRMPSNTIADPRYLRTKIRGGWITFILMELDSSSSVFSTLILNLNLSQRSPHSCTCRWSTILYSLAT